MAAEYELREKKKQKTRHHIPFGGNTNLGGKTTNPGKYSFSKKQPKLKNRQNVSRRDASKTGSGGEISIKAGAERPN